MTPGIMAARKAQATNQMVQAAESLADRFNLPAADLRVVQRDPQVLALYQMEAVARFLTTLVEATDPTTALPSEQARMADLTVTQLKDRISEADAETLDSLESLEQEGKQRKGVLEAIAERREDLIQEADGAILDALTEVSGTDAEGRPLPEGGA